MADKHVIVWEDAHRDGTSLWFKQFVIHESGSLDHYKTTWRAKRTELFSEAMVFDSFTDAQKIYECEAVRCKMGGRLMIRYYDDKEYFKELLAHE